MTSEQGGWVVIAAFVLVFDVLAVLAGRKTLSKGFDDLRRNPKKNIMLAVIWTALTAHLFRRVESCKHAGVV